MSIHTFDFNPTTESMDRAKGRSGKYTLTSTALKIITEREALAARVAELEQLRDGMAEFYGGAVRDAKRYRWLKEYYQRVDIDLELMGVAPDKFDAAFDAMCSAVADSGSQSCR